ncbi:hypothetical protein T4B_9982 [Trichinella pseudospiralis]|uniref:Uncharacterized protein n=2 Tax=Trichinella pseudospiralis TaxID=6337 RepID=A0A0V1FTK6_TRIPS|nr:hypothetical protein T4E_6476 [Trichinella pseudospiralis]KRY89367.1 hypothetical protein T4D_2617 [Trichinella pseudospiralis]KRZ12415.1 hypothetical protein T4B_9982 [Trichinella pseudospiralis]
MLKRELHSGKTVERNNDNAPFREIKSKDEEEIESTGAGDEDVVGRSCNTQAHAPIPPCAFTE